MPMSRVRLYVDHPLAAGQSVPLVREQANYLFNVMRLKPGDGLSLINGRDGEWVAQVAQAGKRAGVLAVTEQTAPLQEPPDLWLVFAPIKKARTDFIVEKAAEMGAARIMPVQTEFTNSERIRRDRLQAHAIEAVEQCGGTFVPEVTDLVSLQVLLADWSPERRILWADEDLAGPVAELTAHAGPWAILIGPEGGFSPQERDMLRAKPFVHSVSLGPRILRADTAAVAAMALWQQALGDWKA
ncbi:MAG: 16S rRNA (uracil(1498)-N(3))-methyltransferase [Rhodobacteraceae bacterium]|nr:16S rRNA (uracil(1498)-N(3))-methyltransferase [Paracoccaceae bacterium]